MLRVMPRRMPRWLATSTRLEVSESFWRESERLTARATEDLGHGE